MSKEIEKLKKEIIEKVEKLSSLAIKEIDIKEARKGNFVAEAKSKLSFLDLILQGRTLPLVKDYGEEF